MTTVGSSSTLTPRVGSAWLPCAFKSACSARSLQLAALHCSAASASARMRPAAAAKAPCLQQPVLLVGVIAAHAVNNGGDVQAHSARHLVCACTGAKAPVQHSA